MSSGGITLCGWTILLYEDMDQEMYCEVVFLRTDKDAIPIIPQQYGYLKQTWPKKTSGDVLP